MNALTRLIAWLLTMLYTWILKPLYKFVVDLATGKTELERIVDRASAVTPTHSNTRNICQALLDFEYMLKDSSDPVFQEILTCRDQGTASMVYELAVCNYIDVSTKYSH